MTQNTPTIYQRLEKLEGELQKLTNTVCSSGGADCLPDA